MTLCLESASTSRCLLEISSGSSNRLENPSWRSVSLTCPRLSWHLLAPRSRFPRLCRSALRTFHPGRGRGSAQSALCVPSRQRRQSCSAIAATRRAGSELRDGHASPFFRESPAGSSESRNVSNLYLKCSNCCCWCPQTWLETSVIHFSGPLSERCQ